MSKKILSLLFAALISSTLITACGNSSADTDSKSKDSDVQSTQNSDDSQPAQSSTIFDTPTVEVKKVVSIEDLKGKDSHSVASVLGTPVNEENNISTYKKDGYTFDITYYDSICGQIKITPDAEMKYPADATNSLKVLGITAGDADTISPVNFVWNNKFNTYKISVIPDNTVENKLAYINVILDEQYK
ncbi:MAG: lipoprotein [Clostridium sp.]